MKNNKGFTLMEILVAMSLMVLVAFVFTPLMLTSLQSINRAANMKQDTLNIKTNVEVGIAKGIDYSTKPAENEKANIKFNQNTTNEGTLVDGKLIDEQGEDTRLTTFLARDKGSLNISPDIGNHMAPAVIKINNPTVPFDDKSKFSLKKGVSSNAMFSSGQDVSNVIFKIDKDSPYNATLEVPAEVFDYTVSGWYIFYGKDYAKIAISPPAYLAIGDGGNSYWKTNEKSPWVKSKQNQRIPGNINIKDMVWYEGEDAGYLAAGESRNLFFLNKEPENSNWTTLVNEKFYSSLGTKETKCLVIDIDYGLNGNLYIVGKTTVLGWFGAISYRRIDHVLTGLNEYANWETEIGDANVESTAVAYGGEDALYGMSTTLSRPSHWVEVQYADRNSSKLQQSFDSRIKSIAWNENEDPLQSEFIILLENGNIYNYYGITFNNNGQAASSMPDNPLVTTSRYEFKIKGSDDLIILDDMPDPKNMRVTGTGNKTLYFYTHEGNEIEIEAFSKNDNASQTDITLLRHIKESRYQQSNVSISGTLNSVKSGAGVWVVVGNNIKLNQKNVAGEKRQSYYYKWNKNSFKQIGNNTTDFVTDDETVPPVPIVWRDTNDVTPGKWKAATSNVNLTNATINKVECINGVFYAVGKKANGNSLILSSIDGKKWVQEAIEGVENINLYGIAGSGE